MFSFPEFSTSKLSFEPTDTGSGFLCFALWHGNERTWGYVKPRTYHSGVYKQNLKTLSAQ